MLRTKSIDENGKTIKMVSTHFEPDKAREAFPCFDEPELRVKYVMRHCYRITLVVEHPSTHRVNSAAPVAKTTKLSETVTRTEFKETKLMSIYLIAINIHGMDEVCLLDQVTVYPRD
eukprot:sb/3476523/